MASGPLGTRPRIEGICTFIFKDSANCCYFSSTISAYFVWMVLSNTGLFLHGQFKSMWTMHNLASAL